MGPKPDELEYPVAEYAGLLGLSDTQDAWPIEQAIAKGLPREALQRVARAVSPDPVAATG